MKVQVVSPVHPKILDQLRAEIQRRHFNIRTEEVYADWARQFILHHTKKHPKDMGTEQVRDFCAISPLSAMCRLQYRIKPSQHCRFYTARC
jgi:hypothetical protein